METPGPSYRATFAVPGFGRLVVAGLIGRAASAMLNVVLVLFVLERFHSPGLAGVAVFASIGPSLFLSPIAGALLDRYGRVRLIMLDYLVAAAALGTMAVLSSVGQLSPPLLVILAMVSGITGMLSAAGMRTVVPLMLPDDLWGRGNAIDSSGYTITIIVGPALGGLLVGLLGPEAAIGVTVGLYATGAASLLGFPEPGERGIEGSLLASSLAGMRYVLRHAILRGMAISLTVLNIGAGILVVAMPVLVLRQMHGDSTTVGVLWALQGVGGAVSGFIAGRFETRRRERQIILAGILATAAATAVIAAAPNVYILGLACLLLGLVTGPLDVTLFSLRQRVTGQQWLGRAIAVSMSLNFAGFPIGSGVSGAFIAVDVRFALAVAAGLSLAGAGLAALLLRPPPMAALEPEPEPLALRG
jgi:MFS family permease